MDALTSQALVSGYRAALVAAERLPLVLPAADDGGRHGPAGQGAGAGRRGGRAAGDRDRQAARRGRGGVRRAARRRPTRCARWAPSSSSSTWRRWRATGGYAREMSDDRAAAPARAARAVRRRRRRADHHRRGARPAGAAAGHPRDGRGDEARRASWSTWPPRPAATSRGRSPARRSLVGGVTVWGGIGRALADAGRREPAVRAQRVRPAAADDRGTAIVAPDFDDEVVAGCWVTRDGGRTRRGSDA